MLTKLNYGATMFIVAMCNYNKNCENVLVVGCIFQERMGRWL